jgi:serine/threonine protein kinase/WD40 repeat protein
MGAEDLSMAEKPINEQAIFEIARKMDSREACEAYLQQVCGDDAAVGQRVRALLVAYQESASFLESPAVSFVTAVDEAIGEHPGTVIGPYKLMEQIGEGGMGLVFVAEQQHPVRRKVAVKVIKPGMDTREVIARFEAERQALALMDHPNIARVFDAGATKSGKPYFVMELVRGVGITEFCDANRLSPRERLELFVQVCQAVQHAHQKGVIHRDLKATNILVTLHDGTPVVKVIDFGVAKAIGQQLTEKTIYTRFAQMIGTPMYMSPEQAEMSGLDIDTRSDIYALGVLLYELLTGATPFGTERLKTATYDEIRRIVREEEPPRPSQQISTLLADALSTVSARRKTDPKRLSQLFRGELDWIVMKALEKDRNRRYETASAFAADVERYLRDEPVQACPPTLGYRVGKIVRRHRSAVLAASLVVFALVGGIIGTSWGMLRATDAESDAVNEASQKVEALKIKEAALAAAKESKRDADVKLFESYLAQARANRMSRRAGQRFESLDVLNRATCLARSLDLPAEKFHDLRNAVIASLALPDLHLTGPWNDWPAGAVSFDFDDTHTIYARTDSQGNCSIRRVADDTELHPPLPVPGGLSWLRLSRDGRYVALVANSGLDLWKLDDEPATRILSEKNGRWVDFHRDGRQVALAYNDGAIRLFELPSGEQLCSLAPHHTLTEEISIALHPKEPLVAICSYHGTEIQIRDVRTGKVEATLPQGTRPNNVAWHPDGRTLAVGLAESHKIRLYDRASRKLFRTLETGSTASFLTFNHAGDRLAVAGWDGFVELFDVGTGQKLFATAPNWVWPRSFRQDDQRLPGGVENGKLGIWQVGDGRELRTLVRMDRPEKALYQGGTAVSPDGRLLAAAMTDGFGLWDLASGSELYFVRTEGRGNSVLFEPSGALLTLTPKGLFRWPIREQSDAAGHCVMGPPEQLSLLSGSALGQSRDGLVIVTCARTTGAEYAGAGGWILHADRPDQPIRIDEGADISWITVSPNSKWVVTVVHPGRSAKIWDARDGRPVKELAEQGIGYPRFSSDSRWLSTSLDAGRLLAVGAWEPGPSVGGVGTFAPPDDKLIAVANQNRPGVIRLVDPATQKEFAVLEDPDLDGSYQPVFTPDGTKIINYGKKGLHVWDLRLIRRHLKAMDLDWDRPDFPPAKVAGNTAKLWKVEVQLGEFGKPMPALPPEQAARQAIKRFRAAVAAEPENAEACNNLAWIYLTGPEPLRDVKSALPLAEKALRLDSANADYRNTLGVAYYRAGRYAKAVETLQPNLAKQNDRGLAHDLYFLAMSHHRLGDTERAQDYLAWAVRWTAAQKDLHPAQNEELNLFRTEATELLKQGSEKAKGKI